MSRLKNFFSKINFLNSWQQFVYSISYPSRFFATSNLQSLCAIQGRNKKYKNKILLRDILLDHFYLINIYFLCEKKFNEEAKSQSEHYDILKVKFSLYQVTINKPMIIKTADNLNWSND